MKRKELTECESGSDEYRADTLEAVGKGTRVPPVLTANVVVIHAAPGTSTADANDSDEDEHDDHKKLEA